MPTRRRPPQKSQGDWGTIIKLFVDLVQEVFYRLMETILGIIKSILNLVLFPFRKALRPLEELFIELSRSMRGRMMITFMIITTAFSLVGMRYAWVQLVNGSSLRVMLEQEVHKKREQHLPRGTIYDSNMKELAISIMVSRLFLDANHIQNPEQVATDLAPLIHVDKDVILKKIQGGGGYIVIKEELTPDEEREVRKYIDNTQDANAYIGLEPQSKRFYPDDMLAANVLGFVSADDKGTYGIEQEYDKEIRGTQREIPVVTDAANQPIFDSALISRSPTKFDGKNIQLTINSQFQFIVEKALDKALKDNKADSVTAIVMDPKTGEVLAMASRPTFDPNHYGDYANDRWDNKAVSDIYEPGSTFKSIVASAGFQEKLVKPTDVYVDPGHIEVSGRIIQNWSGDSFGTVTFLDVVKNSINTGFVQLGLKLGAERLIGYAKKFGFGEVTGIDLPAESPGILFNPKDMVASDIATTSIGQSIAVTPLQMVTAMSAIANGGILMKPHMVKAIYNADGSVYKNFDPVQVRRVIDPEVDDTVKSVLQQVVSTGGGKSASIQGYNIAGKTGTAQKLDPEHGGYLPGAYIASFCGFGPVEDPKFTVLVIINNPKGGAYYGGVIAAPVAHDIFLQLFRYINLKPSNGNENLKESLKNPVTD